MMNFRSTLIVGSLAFILLLTVLIQSVLLYKYSMESQETQNLKAAIIDKELRINLLKKANVQHGKIQEDLVEALILSFSIVNVDNKVSQAERDRLIKLQREIQKIVDASNDLQSKQMLNLGGASCDERPNPCVIMRAIITLSEEYDIHGDTRDTRTGTMP